MYFYSTEEDILSKELESRLGKVSRRSLYNKNIAKDYDIVAELRTVHTCTACCC